MIRLAATLAALFLAALPAAALDKPNGPVVLTVTGAISETNAPGGVEFDLDMLKSLAQGTIVTETPWTEGAPTFSGPLGRALLEAVGASGTMMTVSALNDYSAEVPVTDFTDIDAILAMSIDGKPMSIRDKGPLFIVYPFDDRPDLFDEVHFNRSVWQIRAIEVR